MITRHHFQALPLGVLLSAVCLCGSAVAGSGARAGAESAVSRYQQERALCLSGKSSQDQKTCLKEAGASLQAAKARDLKSPTSDAETANARKRCEAFSGADKETCLARIDDGTKSGSVKGGGELREYREVVPGTAASAP